MISDEGTRVRIETNRSFLTNDIPGMFSQSLSTFIQKMNATATIKFGETLVLSGLSESVQDSAMSKTPLLGDLPIIGFGFKQKTKDTAGMPLLFSSHLAGHLALAVNRGRDQKP